MGMRLGESSSMYGVPHQNAGPPPHHPHQQLHSSGSSHTHHERHRHRGSSASSGGPPGPGGAYDIKSSTASPVMAGLQRPPPFDDRDGRERERDLGPGMSMGGGSSSSRPRGSHSGASGPGMPPGSSLASLPATAMGPGRSQESVTHLLSGPGLHPGAIPKDRERERGMERPLERERDRRGSAIGMPESPGSGRRERDHQREREREQRERERERQMKERERFERQMQQQQQQQQQEREREERNREMRRESQREEDFRRHAREMMGLTAVEREDREREWIKSQQIQAHPMGHPGMRPPPPPQAPLQPMGPPQGEVWPRFVPPRTGSLVDDGRMMRDHEKEMERRRGYEEMRMHDLEWEAEKVEQTRRSSKPRANAKDPQEREQAKAAQREERKAARASATQREKERVAAAKEREKAEMLEAQEREREREKAREIEFRLHEQQLALAKEAQYELMERERMQREMQEMESMRARAARESQGPPPQGVPHHHHHHPYPPPGQQPYPGPQSQSHPRASSSKQGPMGTPGMGHLAGPGEVPPQFVQEREAQFRQGSSQGASQSSISHIVPVQQHQHSSHLMDHHPGPHPHQLGPGPHLRQHPAEMYGPAGPLGYPSRRPSPPPFHPASAPPRPVATSFVFPRSASPPPTLTLPVRHIGTFVYPRTPFPFLDFPAPVTETGTPADPVDFRATIYIPSRFIPLSRPARPRIWGGGLIPAVPPLTGAQRQLVQQFSGGHPGYGRPEPSEIRDGRRVYTDDSDLFLCALHSGWVSWSMARRARRESKDLRLEVRLTREARFVGGLGSPLRMREATLDDEPDSENDGSSLLSSGWGNSHDGSGIEVLKAEFVAPGTAHSFGLRNRSQRLLEYAERRCALGCAPRLGRKRRRLHAHSFADVSEGAIQLRVDRADDDLSSTRVMVFGTDSSWPEIGFKYHPDALKDVLFPRTTGDSRPSKRRRLGSAADQSTSEPATDASSDDGLSQQRAVVVETLWESFLISQHGQIPVADGESDKENASDGTEGGSIGGRRYVIALITNAGGTAGKLPPSAKSAASIGELNKTNGTQSKDTPTDATGGAAAGKAVGTASSEAAGVSAKDASPESTPAPSKASDDADVTDDGNGPIQILHRDLGEENFEFLPDGIHVLSSEVSNGLRKGWKMEAQQWKWVQVGVSS
ncbi:hypothetical protein PYCCODRAFT_1363462 [Trametes coccinea BRFM310]|uniref:Rxt3-domain-containing protein n=1 Tax=Trametes coccinea (strain BRFM310) TaxID=1353009 RepID=A0A1Y2IWB5_TRAC3|nr:hypothetical protein PYCCODRAFT_1363462 [Trametes coccinea BRFM310]